MDAKNLVKIGFLFVFLGAAVSSTAMAVTPVLRFEGPAGAFGIGSEFQVKLLVDSEAPLNAYSVILNFPNDRLEVVKVNDAGSIIDIMRDQPQVFQDGPVKFSGGSLRPFSGTGGLLITVEFRVVKAGSSELNFDGSYLHLADGKGTRVKPEAKVFKIVAREGEPVLKEGKKIDNAPPQVLNLALIDDPISPRQKLVSFLAKDDATGLDKALIQYRKWLFWSDSEPAQNPMALPKSAWAVKLEFYDNTGNVSEKILYDWRAFLSYNLPILLFVLVVGFAVINRIRKRKRYN